MEEVGAPGLLAGRENRGLRREIPMIPPGAPVFGIFRKQGSFVLQRGNCKRYCVDGKFVCASEAWPAEQVRAHMEAVVPELGHWKK